MSTRYRKNIIGYSCELYIESMCENHLDSLTMNFRYCTDTFYLLLTDYIYYINSLCQLVLGKMFNNYLDCSVETCTIVCIPGNVCL